MLKRIGILFLCIAAMGTVASAQGATDALNQFKGKILVLRHPVQSNSPQYDSDGHAIGHAAAAPWTIYGGIFIDKISLKPDQLRMEGRRALFVFLNDKLTLWEYKELPTYGRPPLPTTVAVKVSLAQPLDSAEQAQELMGRVFAMNTTDLLDSIPDLWRGYLHNRLVYDPTAQQDAEFGWHTTPVNASAPPRPAPGSAIRTEPEANIDKIYRVGAEVKPPQPRSTPDPAFTDMARYEKFHGTMIVSLVVDKDGNVHYVHVIRPLGLGLDESAEATLRTWRFAPATRNGEPVAVEMNVEVSFNLY